MFEKWPALDIIVIEEFLNTLFIFSACFKAALG